MRNVQGICSAENDNIGMGLACSQAIVKHLGGDIILK
jgi:sensor histidine kinase regulating citrate/malate metabolism